MEKQINRVILIFTLFICIILVFFSCTKKDIISGQTTKEMLTSRKWMLFRWGESRDGNTVVWETYNRNNDPNFMDDCEKDDYLQFKTDGRLIEHGGVLKCFPSQPDIHFDYGWILQSDNKNIVLDNGQTLRIVNINPNNLQIIEIDSPQPPYDAYDLVPLQ